MASIDDLNGSNDPEPAAGEMRSDVLMQIDWDDLRMRCTCDVVHDGLGEFPGRLTYNFSLLNCRNMELRYHLKPGVMDLRNLLKSRPKRLVFNAAPDEDW